MHTDRNSALCTMAMRKQYLRQRDRPCGAVRALSSHGQRRLTWSQAGGDGLRREAQDRPPRIDARLVGSPVVRRVRRHFGVGQLGLSSGIPVECYSTWRKLHPRVPAAVVDGEARRWKVRVSERTHGNAHRAVVAFLSVKDGGSTDRAEPEPEPGSLIPNADVLGGGAGDRVRGREAGQRSKDAACSLLAGEAVANADDSRLAFNFNPELSTGTRG